MFYRRMKIKMFRQAAVKRGGSLLCEGRTFQFHAVKGLKLLEARSLKA